MRTTPNATSALLLHVVAACTWLGMAGCGSHTDAPKTHTASMTPAAGSNSESVTEKTSGTAGEKASTSPEAEKSSGAAGSKAMSAAGEAASPDAPTTPEVYRVNALLLRDPHLFIAGTDLTDQSPIGVSINNDLVPGGLRMDYDNDGFIDVSIVVRIDGSRLQLVDARCKPDDATHCLKHPSPRLDAEWPIETVRSGACWEPPTSSNYKPAVELPAAPCVATRAGRDVAMTLGGVPIAMTDAQVTFARDGNTIHGLIAGYVTNAKAAQALVPNYVPLLAGSPLANFLHDADRDTAQSPNGEDGYWFYVNFTAESASYAEP